VPLSHKRKKRIREGHDASNVRGILAALRYLSREAESAGLSELAGTLEEAALKCNRSIAAKRCEPELSASDHNLT
jgi:hypothetical protein